MKTKRNRIRKNKTKKSKRLRRINKYKSNLKIRGGKRKSRYNIKKRTLHKKNKCKITRRTRIKKKCNITSRKQKGGNGNECDEPFNAIISSKDKETRIKIIFGPFDLIIQYRGAMPPTKLSYGTLTYSAISNYIILTI